MADRRDRIADDRSGKSPEAYRTIGEVADMLGVAPHVLRFWETRFSQIRPVKRAGNRRYYRPDDIALIERIRSLLHDEGYSIRGVQKLFRETGVKEVRATQDDAGTGPAGGGGGAAVNEELRRILGDLTEIRELLR